MLAITDVMFPGSCELITILIDNGTIIKVGEDVSIPDGTNIINGAGMYALPGFIEAHTHMGGTSTFVHPGCGSREETYDYNEARKGFLDWGVTSVRTCGDRYEDILSYRDELRAGKHTAPRLKSCGPFMQSENGHPWATVYMRNPDVAKNAIVFADQIVPIERQVSQIALLGVDYIKVFYAHLNKMDYPNSVPRMTKEQLKRVIDSAHRNKLKCAVHVDGPEEMLHAAECGADVIEHMIGAGNMETEFDEKTIAAVKASGAIVDPTMISILRFDKTPGFNSVWEDLKKAVKQFYDAGIPMCVGCDSGIPFVPFGESLHDEMACLAESGIPNAEILKMVSETNAKVLGMENLIGSIEEGKLADIVLLGSDPTDDISNTRDIKMVILGGRIVRDYLN